jgi:hypothetical protein
LGVLSSYFSYIKAAEKPINNEERKKNIIRILQSGKSCAQEETVKRAAEQLVDELCVNAGDIQMNKLQNDLMLLEKVEYEYEKIQKVAVILLARYFFNKKE